MDVYCAIDDDRINGICETYNIKYIRTRNDHPNHISRIHEVSDVIKADYYMCINEDEPLISEECILPVIPKDIKIELFLWSYACFIEADRDI